MGLHVMVPLDGSRFAEQAIPHAIDIIEQTGGMLHLVKVHQPPQEAGLGDAMYLCAESLDEEARDEEYRYLAGVAASDNAASVGVCTALISGSVVTGLSDYARSREIDLIVMS